MASEHARISRCLTARAWDLNTGQMLLVFKGHDADIRAVAITPDGKRLVTTSVDKTARVWDFDPKNHPLRTPTEFLHYTGAMTNYRACRDTHEIIAVLPFPDPQTVWAPDSLCAQASAL